MIFRFAMAILLFVLSLGIAGLVAWSLGIITPNDTTIINTAFVIDSILMNLLYVVFCKSM